MQKETEVIEENVLFSLDYLQAGNRLIIPFDGMRYSQYDFPYKLLWKGNLLYAELPASIAQAQSDQRKLRQAAVSVRSDGTAAAQHN